MARRSPKRSPALRPARPRQRKTGRDRHREPPKVALLVETSNVYARDMLAGIEDFIRAHGPWSVYLAETGRGEAVPPWIARWQGDGIIARIENERIAAALAAIGLPVVDLSFAHLLASAPTFTTENPAIGRLAWQHFTERGFQHFAYCGRSEFVWSVDRGECFAREVRAAGFRCDVFQPPRKAGADAGAETDAIAAWLAALPQPLAVLACYDLRGQQVLDAARRAGLAVPEQVAVLGVDNDELLCALSPPPLSSIILNGRRTGWLGAEALARSMAGKKMTPSVHLIPPIGVATRQSTDTLAVADAQLARALRFIRERACEGIAVTDILRHAPMARRSLEHRMRATIGRSPNEEILRVKLARARQLLAATDLSLAEVAGRCGFRHTEYLSVAFKRQIGIPPGQFRRESETSP